MPPKKAPRTPCLACGREPERREAKYCSNACQAEAQYRDFIERWKKGEVSGSTGKNALFVAKPIRRYLMEKYHNRCARCCWSQRHPVTGKIPLTVDHVDGDWSNTTEENLILLCPNCHSLTPTYGSLNRGNGREKARMRT